MKNSIFLIFLYAIQANAQIINIAGPVGSSQYGENVIVLTNGNYVVSDPFYDEGPISDVGAVHLYNGITHTLISTLKGSSSNDQIGGGPFVDPIVALSNGNVLVRSQYWDNGPATDAGAVTWVNGTTGLSGVVSSSNSLVGGSTNDQVGRITLLDNGNYLVVSPDWDNGPATDAGAVTWCNGNTGLSGNISSINSMVGSTANDHIGGIKMLSNGNYLIISPDWTN
ncbi:MAG TPA: hypothetical protein VFD56_01535, partial [Chitinophagaceae bacterium]|nr:hypothetical protein [Chitinophagaceae bacterium]